MPLKNHVKGPLRPLLSAAISLGNKQDDNPQGDFSTSTFVLFEFNDGNYRVLHHESALKLAVALSPVM